MRQSFQPITAFVYCNRLQVPPGRRQQARDWTCSWSPPTMTQTHLTDSWTPHVECDNNFLSLHTSICGVAQSSVLCFTSCTGTLPLSVLASPFPWTSTFMQMILNCTHTTSTEALFAYKMLFNTPIVRWLRMPWFSTLQRLKTYESVNNIDALHSKRCTCNFAMKQKAVRIGL